MTRTVNCRKYNRELPGLERPPFPGQKGEDIYNNISGRARDDWQKHQTMLINERRLNMMNAEDRKFLRARWTSSSPARTTPRPKATCRQQRITARLR